MDTCGSKIGLDKAQALATAVVYCERAKKEAVAFRRKFEENALRMSFPKAALFSLGLALLLSLPSGARSEITASEPACLARVP